LIQGPTIINADWKLGSESISFPNHHMWEYWNPKFPVREMLKTLLCSNFPLIICDPLPEICELFMTSISFVMMNTLTWELIVICSTGVVVVTEDEHCQALLTPPLQACKENQSFSKSVAPATTSTGTHT
jgi:hypothetical protein